MVNWLVEFLVISKRTFSICCLTFNSLEISSLKLPEVWIFHKILLTASSASSDVSHVVDVRKVMNLSRRMASFVKKILFFLHDVLDFFKFHLSSDNNSSVSKLKEFSSCSAIFTVNELFFEENH